MGILALAADERVADVRVTEDELSVRLWDGRTITVPLTWYPRLFNATEEQRNNWQISGGGYGIHWEDIDEDLSTEGLFRGAPAPRQSLAAGKLASSHHKDQDPFESNTASVNTKGTELDNEKGIMGYLAEAVEAGKELGAIMETMGREAAELAAKMQWHSTSSNRLTNEPDQIAAEVALRIIKLSLPDLNTYSELIEGMLPRFGKVIQIMEESFSTIVSKADPESRDDIAKISILQNSLSPILEKVEQPKEAAIYFRDMMISLRTKNLTTEINESSERQVEALNGVISNIEEIESFILRIMYQIK